MRNCLLFSCPIGVFSLLVIGAPEAIMAQSFRYDVVFNELLADPSPVVGLPAEEFIEVLNRSGKTIPLKGWTFSDGSSSGVLPDELIEPGELLILCSKASAPMFAKFGRAIALSTWPTLNNTGELLQLKNEKGALIDDIAYSDDWYPDATKKAGGWTLERINPDDQCSGSQNWHVSTDPAGGTPGGRNSVSGTRANTGFQILALTMSDSVTLKLSFSRFLDTNAAKTRSFYDLNNGVGAPTAVGVSTTDPATLRLVFPRALRRGLVYRLAVFGLPDCAGMKLSPEYQTASFVYPDKIGVGDILVSELLFNPRKNGVDFAEIYNPTDRVFDLRDLQLASTDVKDSLTAKKAISLQTRLLRPGEYLAITSDAATIRSEYLVRDSTSLLGVASLPAWNDDSGTIVLVSEGKRVDQFRYSEKMHFALIRDPEGVSLERSSFTRATNDPGNFRSAASSAGFATPGYRNSQQTDDAAGNEEVYLASLTFSPDNDGFEDELRLHLNFGQPGKVLRVSVYTEFGGLVLHLARNMVIGSDAVLSWDGLDTAGKRLPTGIYSVLVEVFDASGSAKRYKRNCVLAAKL